MTKILGIGNALVDILMQLKDDNLLGKYNLPLGSMSHVDEKTANAIIMGSKYAKNVQLVAGGSAANTINGLAKLGVEVGFIGKIHDDVIGDIFLKDQIDNGVRPLLLKSEKTTGHCTVLISPSGERTMCTYLGAALDLKAEDLLPQMFEGYDCLHIEGYLVQNHDLMRHALEIAKQRKMTISIDMASFNVVDQNLDFLKEILNKYVDIVFANEDEARSFTGKEPEEALNVFADICDIAVVKIGARGSLVKSGKNAYSIGIIPATRVDATGAGDLYASGFFYGLVNNMPLEKCGAIGSLCSGKIVEVMGTKMSDEKWNEIRTSISKIK